MLLTFPSIEKKKKRSLNHCTRRGEESCSGQCGEAWQEHLWSTKAGACVSFCNLCQSCCLLKPFQWQPYACSKAFFSCTFHHSSGFVLTLWSASSVSCFQGLLGFGVSRELRALIALIVFTPAYFHCGCHYHCVMFLLSFLSWLSLPWQAQSDSLIHIC